LGIAAPSHEEIDTAFFAAPLPQEPQMQLVYCRPTVARANALKTALPATDDLVAFETELDFVYRCLRRFGISGADAEDLAQEVFLVVWRRWADYDRTRPLRPWLGGIAFRVASDFRRRVRPEVPAGFVDGPDEAGHLDDQVSARQARQLVRQVLAGLPEKQRVVLIMHDLDGIAMPEIAAALDAPMTTLYSRLVTARRSFARTLKRNLAVAGVSANNEALLVVEQAPDRPPPAQRERMIRKARALLAATDWGKQMPLREGGTRRLAAQGNAAQTPSAQVPRKRQAFGAALLAGAAIVVVLGAAGVLSLAGRETTLSSVPLDGIVVSIERAPRAKVAPATPRTALPQLIVGTTVPTAGEGNRDLVGYWRFDEAPSDGVVRDSSGNGTDCVWRGSIPQRLDGSPPLGDGWSSGHRGGVIVLNGKSWLECPVPGFGRSPDLTVAVWVRRTRPERGMRALVTRQLGRGARDHFFFGFINDDVAISSHVWNGPLHVPLPEALERWVHVAAVHRDGRVKLFVDGKPVAERRSYRGRTVDTASPITIGAGINGPDPGLGTQGFAGQLDDLVVARQALDDGAIAALAASGSSATQRP
jgi:RNA polymerase sigma-70 factor, ECF subfamily